MTVERQLAALAERLQALEDREAIRNAIAGYGPAVDTCDSAAATALWADDGVYDVGGFGASTGHAAIRALFDGPVHQGLIAGGAAHMLSPVHIRIDGDAAVATGYSCLFRHADGGFHAERVSANRWTLRRAGDGWRVVLRVNRLLDGSPEARALLTPPA
ncbi:SnoaL-like domain-containing protein [Sphingomonas laterariae]|uniref:SnoaL-like domain-containing protein n=1 Tax=Edaphosphingomonas laterariae TaxID=861865 RepID=A0A239BW77_9SPHN|nr:nuclear transport factor 2 family protein [Sphingomonas laterariae]SNS11423.1 SnoaL-like domain-containing protein [Sphingomonas laterariae]